MKAFVISAELARILQEMDGRNEFQSVIEWHGKHRAIYVQSWFVKGEMESDSVDSDSMMSYTDYDSIDAQKIISDNNNVAHAMKNGYLIDLLKTIIEGNLDISMFNYASRNQLKHAVEAMANLVSDEQEWLNDPCYSVFERQSAAVDLTARLIGYYERS